jgi:23S rRNA pseudouridine1911/1915/1917 synthase
MLARSADRVLSDEDRERLELERHALHAHRYELPHAVTGARVALTSPLPPDLAAFWEAKGGTVFPGVPVDPAA